MVVLERTVFSSHQIRCLQLLLLNLCGFTSLVVAFNDAPSSGCLNIPYKKDRGLIESPEYPMTPEGVCREYFIYRQKGEIITISFLDLNLPSERPEICTGNVIKIGPVPNVTLCGRIEDGIPPVYISERNHVWIHFWSSSVDSGRGFKLQYIAGQTNSSGCLDDQFLCGDGHCILKKWLCNGAYECKDKSDEEHCTGINRLTTPSPYFCGDNKFGCISTRDGQYSCFRTSKMCDGVNDCLDGKDEAKCSEHRKCMYPLEGPTGTFSPPIRHNLYNANDTCDWLIHVTHGHVVQLRLNIVGNFQDKVVVYDGGSMNDTVIATIDGPAPSVIESTSNRMYVSQRLGSFFRQPSFNATYQMKGVCLPSQRSCGFNEFDCYEKDQRCDGIWQCRQHGGDERGCGKCASNLFQCGSKGLQCFEEAERCNGNSHCSENDDEKYCSTEVCGPHNGTFLCRNARCVYESWRCDGANDCGDNSDELNCSVMPSTRVVTAAVIGSMICFMLLVIALSCTCKLHALRLAEQRGHPRYISPMTQLQEEMFARRPAPPPYLEAMRTSRNFDEAQRESLQALRSGARSRRSRRSRSHRGERSNGARSVQNQNQPSDNVDAVNVSGDQSESSTDDSLINVNVDNRQQRLPSDCDLLSDLVSESDSNCDESADLSGVHVNVATGGSAHWTRRRNKHTNDVNLQSNDILVPVGETSNDVILPLEDDDKDSTSGDSSVIEVPGSNNPEITEPDSNSYTAESTVSASEPDTVAPVTYNGNHLNVNVTSDGESINSGSIDLPNVVEVDYTLEYNPEEQHEDDTQRLL